MFIYLIGLVLDFAGVDLGETTASESIDIFLSEYNADEVSEIDPYELEKVVAKAWEEDGWDVEIKKKSVMEG
jgi:hypothetical protein